MRQEPWSKSVTSTYSRDRRPLGGLWSKSFVSTYSRGEINKLRALEQERPIRYSRTGV